MEGKRSEDIRGDLTMLPRLEEQRGELQRAVYEAEDEVRRLKYECEVKSQEVKKLERGSSYTILLRLTGQYYRRLDMAKEEFLTLRMEYDRACNRLEELRSKRMRLSEDIGELRSVERRYEGEMKRREEILLRGEDSEIAVQYRQLEGQRKKALEKLTEINRAIGAANKIKHTAHRAMKSLSSAHGWATYDVWTKGGIFSHIAKYDHIDNAQTEFNNLNVQLKELQRRLSDANVARTMEPEVINATTRAVDYWMDNIFTDLNVRSKIRENQEKLRRLEGNVDTRISKLMSRKAQIQREIDKLEDEKRNLIMSDWS